MIRHPRGRPLLLDDYLKLRTMIVTLRIADASVNVHIIRGVLNDLVRVSLKKFGRYIDFQVSRS